MLIQVAGVPTAAQYSPSVSRLRSASIPSSPLPALLYNLGSFVAILMRLFDQKMLPWQSSIGRLCPLVARIAGNLSCEFDSHQLLSAHIGGYLPLLPRCKTVPPGFNPETEL